MKTINILVNIEQQILTNPIKQETTIPIKKNLSDSTSDYRKAESDHIDSTKESSTTQFEEILTTIFSESESKDSTSFNYFRVSFYYLLFYLF